MDPISLTFIKIYTFDEVTPDILKVDIFSRFELDFIFSLLGVVDM